MSARLPAQASSTRVIHYVDAAPARRAEVPAARLIDLAGRAGSAELLHAAAVLAVEERQRIERQRTARHEQYLLWLERQAAFERSDRRVRRFMLGAGGVVGLGVLGGVGYAAWWLYDAVTASAALPVLGIAAVVVAGAGLVAGGRRCITVVQHWHE